MKYFLNVVFVPLMVVGSVSAGIINVPGDQPTIQAGIDAAVNGDTVLVAEGTYYENINFTGKAITVASYFLIDGDSSHISNTIIDGSQPSHQDSGSVVMFHSGEDPNAVIEGFTLRNGTGTIVPNILHGGGISCWGSSSPTIKCNIIVNNIAGVGGGIGCSSNSNAIISNNIFRDNGPCPGSAIICGGSSPIIVRNLVYNNTHNAIELQVSNSIIANNTICFNDIGIRNHNNSFGRVINSIVYFNYQDQISSSPDSSIAVNYSDVQGGWPNDLIRDISNVENQLLWNNGNNIWDISSSAKSIFSFSEIANGGRDGNIDVDPLFVDAMSGNFHLQESSPCIDAGDPTSPLDPDSTRADMGAFYFDQSQTSIDSDPINLFPTKFGLEQNYPNPFNPSTAIEFSLPRYGYVRLQVFNILGEEVTTLVNEELNVGTYSTRWNASGVGSGLYFYRLQARPTDGGQAGDFVDTKKLLLLK